MHGINNFWMRGLILVAVAVIACSLSPLAHAQVEYPVGTTIEVTETGVTVTAPVEVSTVESTNDGYTPEPDTGEYCYGADYSFVECDASRNFDPWIARTGEKNYWIRNRLTLAIPFTLPARGAALDARFGYFQMTAPERKRDPETEDIFRVWFSEEPNGVPLGGKGSNCEKWMVQARGYLYWTQDADLAADANVCFLGHSENVLYANFETACYAPRYEGECSETNRQKSYRSYQFDVARGVKGY